ncbi:RagB/SusD family nutrient uptake outer membrane protein [Chitinophaga caseinilytica]|uniref:RagB/SusD family nutrient uptake outer membrane protein n=1 Tax=Chitinophaga caseinilytica TaxID=2267521 RepID=A0ABZ2Z8F2_9BACT
MQKHLKIYALLALLSTTGCKKFLEQPPDNRAVLNTPEQVSRLLGTAYPGASYVVFAELSSDNVTDRGGGSTDNEFLDPFTFADVRSDQQDSPEFYWDACYTAIAAANEALQVCEKAPNPSAYMAQKGEALLCRAYAHFMLVTFFSEIYDPATAATKAGIPYVTEPEKEVVKQYDRKTVAYVYEMIEKDLLAGLPLIDEKTYSVPRYHFNKAAANAFAARFYLFKKDYTKVVQHANAVFSDGTVVDKLRPWNSRYLQFTAQEMMVTYAKATEPANLLLCETASWYARGIRSSRYGLNRNLFSYYFNFNVVGADWSFLNQAYIGSGGTTSVFFPKVNEYFVRQSVNAEIGSGYVMVPLFTTEEVLFNRAEANAYLNNTASALQDLNAYSSTHFDNYNPSADALTMPKIKNYYGNVSDRDGIILTVLDFKQAEFMQEGMRWFDILRYRIPVVHETIDGKTYSLTANDPRRLFQIPQSAGESGVPQNPR